MIIVINCPQSLREFIFTIPLAAFIKKHYPDYKIVYLVNEHFRFLLAENPGVDEVWAYPSHLSWLGAIKLFFKKAKGKKIQALVHLDGKKSFLFSAFLKRVTFRAGQKKGLWQSLLLNRAQRQFRYLAEMHEAEYNLNLLSFLPVKYHYTEREELAVKVVVHREDSLTHLLNWAEDKDLKFPAHFESIVLAPSKAQSGMGWPTRNYFRLLKRIERRYPGRFVYFVFKSENEGNPELLFKDEMQKDKMTELSGRTFFLSSDISNSRHILHVVSLSTLVVGANNNIAHIANAMAVNTIMTTTPIKAESSFLMGPFNQNNSFKSILPEAVCGETFRCSLNKCPYYDCMARIEVDWVLEKSVPFLMDSNKMISLRS